MLRFELLKQVLVTSCATLLLTCACARVPLRERDCGGWTVCTPERAISAPLDVLRTNGSKISLDCGTERESSDRLTRACRERVKPVIAHLSRLGIVVAPMQAADIVVKVGETCLDTFVSGREADDCGFYSYSVDIAIVKWPS